MRRYFFGPGLVLGLCLSCSANNPPAEGDGGGSGASSGGALSAGGSTATGGASGGSTASGGAPTVQGGMSGASGGALGGAGASSFGGAPSAGGQSGAFGGAGSAGVAGTSTGGVTASSGGAGASNAGGSGGNAGSGGALATGGSGGSAGSTSIDPGTEGDGDFVVGPTYTKSPELTPKAGGKDFNFTMQSADSKIFTGLDTTLTSPKAFSRRIDVHVPAGYRDGTPAPFMVVQDGAGGQYTAAKAAVDNLSQAADPARRLPALIVIAVANGGGDSLGSQRGLEYDTMSDRYARLIDEEVLPAVIANASVKATFPNLKFTDDPDGRGTLGCSSGASAAVIMGWFKPDRYRRIIGYSTTLVAQQDTDAPERTAYPHGAWDFHSDLALIANNEKKPLRVFINANENDNGAGTGAGNRHDWLLANQRTAAAFKSKGYHYRYVEGKAAGHCDAKVLNATLVDALLWVWRGYPTAP